MGAKLMRCGSPFGEPSPLYVNPAIGVIVAKVLVEGKGGAAKFGQEEAEGQGRVAYTLSGADKAPFGP